MKEIILYQEEYEVDEAIEHFMDEYYSTKMTHLASDLLSKDFPPGDIVSAVRKAVNVCRTAGLDTRRHFFPIYTQYKGSIVKDCKLSHLGYCLVLLNAPEGHRATSLFQVELVEVFLLNLRKEKVNA